jgi:signal transduction histidine kinase
VAHESVQNVIKHAKAKYVSLSLRARKGSVILAISDNGDGFSLQAVKGRGGLGLIGIEERVRLVGGKLLIETQPGDGTKIAIEIPLPRV